MISKLNSTLKKLSKKLWLDMPFKVSNALYKEKLTEKQKQVKSLLTFFKANNNKENFKGIVLVAEVKNLEYIVRIASLSKLLAEKHACVVKSYNVYIDPIDNWHFGVKERFIYQMVRKLRRRPLTELYGSFAVGGQIHDNSTQYSDQGFISGEKKKILGFIDTNDLGSINNIVIEDILVGDLIYDTYLRSFHEPTIDSMNNHIELVVEWALNIFYTFKEVLENNPVSYLINSYTTYLHFGITTRLSLSYQIKVYTIGSSSYRAQLLDNNFPFHQINHSHFDGEKVLSHDQIVEVKNIFEKRFAGKIDNATSYMRTSAFKDRPVPDGLKELFNLRKRNIIIYAHDFYDSPHVNRKLAFPDLYQFLKQTLESICDITDTTVFIKTHPNGIPGCKEKTIDLVNSFNQDKYIILDENVNNLHIIDMKPDLIVTARGTVCVEMAYFGIPTVALFDNIFANFRFTQTCHDITEYFDIIKGIKLPSIDFEKTKILSFYYQAYLEQLSDDDNHLFEYLRASKFDSYSDEYAAHLLHRKEDLFSEKLLKEYTLLV